jgi:hypothetical protein
MLLLLLEWSCGDSVDRLCASHDMLVCVCVCVCVCVRVCALLCRGDDCQLVCGSVEAASARSTAHGSRSDGAVSQIAIETQLGSIFLARHTRVGHFGGMLLCGVFDSVVVVCL